MAGDTVIKINDVDVYNLRHKEAQDVVVRSGNNFVMTVQRYARPWECGYYLWHCSSLFCNFYYAPSCCRGGSTWRPQVVATGPLPKPNSSFAPQTVTKTSLAHKQAESQHIGCGYNNAARPFVSWPKYKGIQCCQAMAVHVTPIQDNPSSNHQVITNSALSVSTSHSKCREFSMHDAIFELYFRSTQGKRHLHSMDYPGETLCPVRARYIHDINA